MGQPGAACSERHWLGISSQDPEKWVDGTSVTFSYWSSKPSWDCTSHYATGGAWKSEWCGMLFAIYRFVCQLRLSKNFCHVF